MAVEGVPWFVANTDPDPGLLRSLVWAATGGEGIVAGPDFYVTALGAPAAAVVAGPGAAVVQIRTSGATAQAYATRALTETQVDVTPTTPAGPRTDLVILRVEDPNVDGAWPIPDDPTVGPYVSLRMIEDVPVGTTSVQQVPGHEGDAAVTLARLDIPANTTAITQAMITDLRALAKAQEQRLVRYLSGSWATPDLVGPVTDDWEEFPLGAHWDVPVPSWATRAVVEADWAELLKSDTVQATGHVRVELGDAAGSGSAFATNSAGRHHLIAGGEFPVAAADRGTVMTVTLQGKGDTGNTGSLAADVGSTVRCAVTFLETPSTE